jgi:hypothetical protein
MEVSLPLPVHRPASGQVTFHEELSWHHSTGVVVPAGAVGEVCWQFGDRLAVLVDGVMVHSVPIDAVAWCDKTREIGDVYQPHG